MVNIGAGLDKLGGAIGDFGAADLYSGAAAGDLLSAKGYDAEAASYTKAAGIVGESKKLAELGAKIDSATSEVQQNQTFRQTYKMLGGLSASFSGSGLALSGSAVDVMRASAQQGELQSQLVTSEGQARDITNQEGIKSQEAQIASYEGLSQQATASAESAREAAAANASASGKSKIGGVLGVVSSIFSIFCWVAREVYGADNPRWRVWREYMFTKAPLWFFKAYAKHGEQFAQFISDKPRVKWCVRWLMERTLKNAGY